MGDNGNETGGGGDPIAYGILPSLLGYQLRRAQVALFKHFTQTIGPEGDITPGSFGTLTIIGENPGLSQSRLAAALDLDRSTIVAVIDRLEQRGLVVRERLTNDRRTYALKLTLKGRRLVEKLSGLIRAHEDAFAGSLSPAERETLMALLSRLTVLPQF